MKLSERGERVVPVGHRLPFPGWLVEPRHALQLMRGRSAAPHDTPRFPDWPVMRQNTRGPQLYLGQQNGGTLWLITSAVTDRSRMILSAPACGSGDLRS